MNKLFANADYWHLSEVDSTNAELKRQLQLQSHLPEGATVRADYQTLGRGQYGSGWESSPGENLLLSQLWRPRFLQARHSFALNVAVCLALHDVLSYFHEEFLIKWPNDLICRERKYCGVLVETQIMGGNIETAIVGLGLNVNQESFLAPRAGSLCQLEGAEFSIARLESTLREALRERYQQMQSTANRVKMQAEYLGKLYGYQHWVPIEKGGHRCYIQIRKVSADGFLDALSDDGKVLQIGFKEVTFLLG